ncbi:basic proline-rich protein [Streptomyces sp. SPB074]|nr:basic proline-rich protein [Streptomyces sp. SPB074]
MRDLLVAGGHPGRVWWLWAGSPSVWGGNAVQVTSLGDGVLAVLGAWGAVRGVRAPRAAAPAFAAVGACALVVRLPPSWLLAQPWTGPWAGPGPHTLARFTDLAGLLLGVLLLGCAFAARRPRAAGAVPPSRTAAALLLFSAGLLAVWEAVRAEDYGGAAYRGALLGNRSTTLTLLAVPRPWWAAALVLLALLAGIACAARARAGRALGTAAGAMLLAWGLVRLSVALRQERFDGALSGTPRLQLSLASTLAYVLAGLAVLALLRTPAREGAASPAPLTPPAR